MTKTAALKSLSIFSTTTTPEGFAVCKNSDVVKTPAGKPLIVPTEKLATAIVKEWRAQKEKIIPASMPMMQLAATAIDIAAKDRATIDNQLTSYIRSELLCHHADHPDALKQLQKKKWQPILDWCALRFDAVLLVGTGIMPIDQSVDAHKALRRAIEDLDNFHSIGLRHAVDVCGSLILGLALMEEHLSPQQVLEAAELDANFQMQQWGEDPAIVDKQKSISADLMGASRWFRLLKSSA